jgi:hypothetical protein
VPQIKFYKYTNKKWTFFNVYLSRANTNNFPRHKYTNEQPQTKKLCTHLLCICVSVYELIKSQKNLGPKEH